jgi:hypothetical protein
VCLRFLEGPDLSRYRIRLEGPKSSRFLEGPDFSQYRFQLEMVRLVYLMLAGLFRVIAYRYCLNRGVETLKHYGITCTFLKLSLLNLSFRYNPFGTLNIVWTIPLNNSYPFHFQIPNSSFSHLLTLFFCFQHLSHIEMFYMCLAP